MAVGENSSRHDLQLTLSYWQITCGLPGHVIETGRQRTPLRKLKGWSQAVKGMFAFDFVED